LAEHIGPIPYVQWQQLLDPGAPPGRHHYWKNATYATLTDATIDTLAGAAEDLPSPETEIHLQHLGGAVGRVADVETAFASRHAGYFINLLGTTSSSEEFGALRSKVRNLYGRLTSEALSPRLPNFVSQDDGDWPSERLTGLRRRYDPDGLFVRPSSPPNL
jgi:hypothetical protein